MTIQVAPFLALNEVNIDFAGLMQAGEFIPQFQISLAENELAFKVKNYNAFALALLDVQARAHPSPAFEARPITVFAAAPSA